MSARATFFTGQSLYAGRGEVESYGVNEAGDGQFWVDISVKHLAYAQSAGVEMIIITSSPASPAAVIADGMNRLTMRPNRPLELRLGDMIHLTMPVSELLG